MCERKYHKYEVVISYLNGDKETIQYEEDKSRNYTQMLQLYRQTKEQYKDDCCTIQFVGVMDNGNINVFFEKCLASKEDLNIKQNADHMAVSDGTDFLLKLKDAMEEVQKYRAYIKGQEMACNKKQDVILHQIESIENDNPKDDLRLFNELKQIRIYRRKAKNGNKLMEVFYDKLNKDNVNLKHICNLIESSLEGFKQATGKIVPLTDEKVEEFKIMRQISYRNFKERLNLTKQLKDKYDKITYDDSDMVLTVYNKAK